MGEIEKIDILLVDDREENLFALESLLESPELNIVKATSGSEALELLLEYNFAIVLLDVQMPGMDGFETAKLMRGSVKTKHIPIIFVTAISKEQKYVSKGYETGAVDYLLKPINPDILKSKIKVFLELYRQKKLLEEANEMLEKMASTDNLTGVYNRRKFEEFIHDEIARSVRYKRPLCLVIFDIDHFKRVNDTYGHDLGDVVLKEIAAITKIQVRQSDYLVRWGGEEFIILAPETPLAGAVKLAEKVRKEVGGHKFPRVGRVTISLGVSQFKEGDSFDCFLKRADKALYHAKQDGRNCAKKEFKDGSEWSVINPTIDVANMKNFSRSI